MSATITDEQFAVRDLIRSWAAGTGAPDTVRDVEHGRGDAWQAVYDGIAELGLFGVAVEETAGGAGGSVTDLCAMVEARSPRRHWPHWWSPIPPSSKRCRPGS